MISGSDVRRFPSRTRISPTPTGDDVKMRSFAPVFSTMGAPSRSRPEIRTGPFRVSMRSALPGAHVTIPASAACAADRFSPKKPSFASPATWMDALRPTVPASFTSRQPPSTRVVPVYVFVPKRTSVPYPAFVRPPPRDDESSASTPGSSAHAQASAATPIRQTRRRAIRLTRWQRLFA